MTFQLSGGILTPFPPSYFKMLKRSRERGKQDTFKCVISTPLLIYKSFFIDFGVMEEQKELTFVDKISLHQAQWWAIPRHHIFGFTHCLPGLIFIFHVKKLRYKFTQLTGARIWSQDPVISKWILSPVLICSFIPSQVIIYWKLIHC